MKRTGLVLILLLFKLHILAASETFNSMDKQAKAFLNSQNFTQTEQLYDPLLKQDLPSWQQARVRYNLGTIKLAQKDNEQAIQFLQSMQSTTLSLPIFARDLSLNQGIAYLQKSQELSSSSSSLLALDQQQLFILRAVNAFKQAQQLECVLQEKNETECQLTHQLTHWEQVAQQQLMDTQQMRRQQWINQASIPSLATLLQTSLNQLNDRFLPDQTAESSAYFYHQMEGILPIWFALQKQAPESEKEKTIQQAIRAFIQSSKNLKNNEFLKVKDNFKQVLEALNLLVFPSTDLISPLLLNFEIFLLQQQFTPKNLESLKLKITQLPASLNQEKVKQAQTLLQQAIDLSKETDSPAVLFFLLASFNALETLKPADQSTPISALKEALKQANHALQLTFLRNFLNDPLMTSSKSQLLVKEQQQQVLKQSQLFIPLVLEAQQKAFEITCQQSPWDQVIPLFAKGESHARQVIPLFDDLTAHEQQITYQQQQILKNWEQALEALKKPPQQNPPSPNNDQNNSSTSKEEIHETFRLIQEMFSEDDSKEQDNTKELEQW
jgi:hypothetical protein